MRRVFKLPALVAVLHIQIYVFLTGTMGDEIDGQPSPPNLGLLSRIDDEMKHVVEISPVSISNGLAWNIQDDTFYYIDSPTRVIAAYDYDPINGKISKKSCCVLLI